MILLVSFAFLAGIVTVLSPCILPVLPVVLAGGAGGGKSRPLGVAVGFIGSFSILTLTLSSIVRATGLDPDILRWISAALILAFGAVLVVPALKDAFMGASSRLLALARFGSRPPRAAAGPGGARREGFGAGLVLGLGLGVVWTPCAGPIMASVITLALTGSVDAGTIVITLAYALGTAIPLFLVMIGGRALLQKAPRLVARSAAIQRAFGILMMATAVALFTGADRAFSSWILKVFPSYGSGLTAIEERPEVRAELEKRAAATDDSVGAAQDGSATLVADVPVRNPDPLGLGSGAWLNSPPLSLAGLKGKVVLVDFWTYSCINCVRTLPYLRAWHNSYSGEGLVIVGVHSPEFAFERSEANLRKAMSDLGVTWPVVQDNDFGIWKAFSNRYWPAHYLFDREGKLIETHFGEGGYAWTEAAIVRALGLSGAAATADPAAGAIAAASGGLTPETYLGYGRGQRFSSPEDVAPDAARSYTSPGDLAPDRWAFEGSWTIGEESSLGAAGSAILLRYRGERVYLVAGPADDRAAAAATSPIRARVSIDGKAVETVALDGYRMYAILERPEAAGGLLRIEFELPVRVYAFTFG